VEKNKKRGFEKGQAQDNEQRKPRPTPPHNTPPTTREKDAGLARF